MIEPTIGREVWYQPNDYDGDVQRIGPQPMSAKVVYVWHDRSVNLVVLDHQGQPHVRLMVPLAQEGDEPKGWACPYCEWMPYQKGQAAKTESAEAELAVGYSSLT